MATFRHHIAIAATPEAVWEVLGDLSSVTHWIPGVTGVDVDGLSRVCTFEDGHTQAEVIHDYDPNDRSFRYVIEGAPLPVTDNVGAFSVVATDTGCQVVWESSFSALDPAAEEQIALMWEPYLPMTLERLKELVERSVAATRSG